MQQNRDGKQAALRGTGVLFLCTVIALSMAASYRRNAHYRDDISLFSTTALLSPGKARPHCLYGRALIDGGREADAVREMESAADLADRSAVPPEQIYSGLAVALLATGRVDDASRAAGKALAFAPGSVHALNAMGQVLFAKGEYGQAARYFEKAVEREPHDAAAVWNAATAWQKAGNDALARQYALRYLSEAPDEASRRDGRVLLEQITRHGQKEPRSGSQRERRNMR